MAALTAVILAGGAGTRLRARVPDLPKPMAPVHGRPFLEYVLDRLIASGIARVVLALGYRAEAITGHFGASYRGAALSYSIEAQPLGTGGSLLAALNTADTEPVLALNGDTLLDLDYSALGTWYAQAPEPLAMVVRQVPDAARLGVVMLDGERATGFEEKRGGGPAWINAGVYVVQPQLFERLGLRGAFSLEREVLEKHCAQLRPRTYRTDAYFIDIGVPADYERAQRELPLMHRPMRGG